MDLYIVNVSKNKIMHLMMNCYGMFMMYMFLGAPVRVGASKCM